MNYDTTPVYVLGLYVGKYPLSPLLVVLHPLGELLV